MRSMDLPPRRPLDDFDDPAVTARVLPGVPDGRARSPSELFDNLRLRLSELAANHPSAHGQADRPEPAGRYRPAGQDAPLGTDQDDRGAAPETRGAEDMRQGDTLPLGGGAVMQGFEPGDAGQSGAPDQAILAARMVSDSFAGAAETGALAMMNFAAEIGSAEAYAPWFMSGEGAMPWWAAGDDLWG